MLLLQWTKLEASTDPTNHGEHIKLLQDVDGIMIGMAAQYEAKTWSDFYHLGDKFEVTSRVGHDINTSIDSIGHVDIYCTTHTHPCVVAALAVRTLLFQTYISNMIMFCCSYALHCTTDGPPLYAGKAI